jgi:MATE family multidrug resistance protein
MVGSFFTTDEVVIAIVTDAMPMLTIYLAFDAIHGA